MENPCINCKDEWHIGKEHRGICCDEFCYKIEVYEREIIKRKLEEALEALKVVQDYLGRL